MVDSIPGEERYQTILFLFGLEMEQSKYFITIKTNVEGPFDSLEIACRHAGISLQQIDTNGDVAIVHALLNGYLVPVMKVLSPEMIQPID